MTLKSTAFYALNVLAAGALFAGIAASSVQVNRSANPPVDPPASPEVTRILPLVPPAEVADHIADAGKMVCGSDCLCGCAAGLPCECQVAKAPVKAAAKKAASVLTWTRYTLHGVVHERRGDEIRHWGITSCNGPGNCNYGWIRGERKAANTSNGRTLFGRRR